MEHLPFWHFFQEIETTLSYERWLEKYKLFLNAISNGLVKYDGDLKNFKQFCKILYLQEYRDEALFDQLLEKAINREQKILTELLKKWQQPAAAGDKKQETPQARNKDEAAEGPPEPPAPVSRPPEDEPEELRTPQEHFLFFNPPDTGADASRLDQWQAGNRQPVSFLQTDEYFPVTRRQMVKGWQFFRHTETIGYSTEVDVPATIDQIVREGIFREPRYRRGSRNREDTLLFFADFRGSMTPFHELSRRLIQSARNEGGHPQAPVYYFQNQPVGYVYRQSNLSDPVNVKEALLKANRNFTLAIVISDAGAVRGSNDAAHNQERAALAKRFLDQLNERCAHTIWLNPMPVHRWPNTPAALIRNNVLVMAPLLEESSYNFQETLRMILKQNFRTLNRNQ